MTSQRETFTLKGSAHLITQFLGYAVNSILHQRGVYPDWSFDNKIAYGMELKVTEDEQLSAYLGTFLYQLKDWLVEGKVRRVVLVILSTESGDGLERWTFDVDKSDNSDDGATHQKRSIEDIRQDITAIMCQVMSSVTFLPALQEKTGANLAALALGLDVCCGVVTSREEAATGAPEIQNPSQLELLPFATNAHRLEANVAYKTELP